MGKNLKKILGLCLSLLLLVVSLQTSSYIEPISKAKVDSKVTASAVSKAGGKVMVAGGALWFKTSYETRTNSPSAVFEVPNDKTKYYVYICQRCDHRDQWSNRDRYIPKVKYTAFNMLKTGQADVLGNERTYPWKIEKERLYWLREVDPVTNKPYVVYSDGSIGEESPSAKNTNVIAPAMLVPK